MVFENRRGDLECERDASVRSAIRQTDTNDWCIASPTELDRSPSGTWNAALLLALHLAAEELLDVVRHANDLASVVVG